MYRFTIREIVLLTVIVAMGMGWWLDRRSVAAARDQAFLDIRTLASYTTPGGGYPMTDEVKAILLPIYNKYCGEN